MTACLRIGFVTLSLVICIAFRSSAADSVPLTTEDKLAICRPPTEERLAKLLGGQDVLTIIREAQRVEAVRVVKLRTESKAWVAELGKPFAIDQKLAAEVKELLGNRETYWAGGTSCEIYPTVKFVFYHVKLGTVALELCLKCADLAVEREGKHLGHASFSSGRRKVVDLAITVLPEHRDIEEMLEAEQRQLALKNAEETLWRASMPKSLLPFWDQHRWFGAEHLPLLRAALKQEFPEITPRILALLTWYGSDGQAWHDHPSREDAERLLLDFHTAELLIAIESVTLTRAQTEGAMRLFSGWTFRQTRPADLRTLPVALKRRLSDHSVTNSTDPEMRGRADHSFSSP